MTNESLPDTSSVAEALLRFLRDRRRPMKASEVYEPLAEIMSLTGRQKMLKRQTADRSLWENRVQTARNHLVKNGLMQRLPRDSRQLTDAGRKEAFEIGMPVFTLKDLDL